MIPPPRPSHEVAGDITGDVADEVLARRAAMGDRAAFTVIVDRHGPALYRYAARMLSDTEDAQEAVQDALLAAWRDLDRFAGRSTLRTWLFSLTAHKARDIRARRRPAAVLDQHRLDPPAGPGTDPLAVTSYEDLIDALDRALATLPPRQRAVWLLTQVEELSYTQTAHVLATTPDAVRGLLSRARTALRERMKPWR